MDDATYQRFMTKVSLSGNANYRRISEEDSSPMTSACWLWLAGTDRDGYGQFTVHGRTELAHRLAYEHWHGPIGPGLLVLHRCDVRVCVNPAHLTTGSHTDNVADKVSKGRQARGEQNGRAKLTADEAYELRLLGDALPRAELARQYAVSPRLVRKVLSGELWHSVLAAYP